MSSSDVTYDLLIVGGGINGAGIACDAAGRGLSVALCEQGDLAGATSSASSKMIHGGLRYLEFYEFRLVREALAEREVMLSKAPHLIRPLRLVLPHQNQVRPAWMVRLGLFLYDHLARHPRLPNSTGIDLTKHHFGAPLQDKITKGFLYSDCWVDDARLVVANARAAADYGADIMVRTKLVAAERHGGIWRALLKDTNDGAETQVSARALVNASGPWVQTVLDDVLAIQHDNSVVLVKGSHIIVPKLYDGAQAYLLQNPDRRVIFVIPFEEDFSVIGTTDVAVAGDPASPEITAEETEYLCTSVNAYFKTELAPSDVVRSFAGVRPLFNDAEEDVSKVSRDYVLDLLDGKDEAPLLSVFGGKITAYRRLAEEALERLRPYFPTMASDWTADKPLPGGDLPNEDFSAFVTELKQYYVDLDPDYLSRLARRHGTAVRAILGTTQSVTDLGRDFGGGLFQIEIDYLMLNEWARSGDDILWRRTKTGLRMGEAERVAVCDYVAGRMDPNHVSDLANSIAQG